MQVNWATPPANGDAIRSYQLEVWDGSTLRHPDAASPEPTARRSWCRPSETAYTYRIRGHNKAGWGELSADVRAATRRGRALSADDHWRHAGDRQLTVTYTPGSRGGACPGEVASTSTGSTAAAGRRSRVTA